MGAGTRGTYRDDGADVGRWQNVAAIAITLGFHLAIFAMFLMGSGNALNPDDGGKAAGDGGLEVVFVAVDAASHQAPHSTTQASVVSPSASFVPPTSETGEQAPEIQSESKQSSVDKRVAETIDEPTTEPGASTSTAESAAGSSDQPPTPKDAYLAAVRAAVLQRWDLQHPGEKAPHCTLAIDQVEGGQITGTHASDCSMSEAQSLQAAAALAQPLPYAGYEDEFSTHLQIEFE